MLGGPALAGSSARAYGVWLPGRARRSRIVLISAGVFVMNKFGVFPFSKPDALAQAAALHWIRTLEIPIARPYCVGLSGGRIARRFFTELTTISKRRQTVLGSLHYFWADERCVPPTDPESNFTIARELLFAPLAIPEEQIHRIRGEAPPEAAASQAEAGLRRIARANDHGRPILDAIFLGMGEDGHVASLFPGEPPEAMANPAVYRPVVAAKPPPHRITLGYQAIADARQVWVLASGPGKEKALRESLSPLGQTPLARVLQSRAHTFIFTDVPSD